MPSKTQVEEQDRIAAQISDFESRIEVPSDFEGLFKEWEVDREYAAHVNRTGVTREDTTTNHILTTIQQLVADIYPRDPAAVISPAPWIPAAEDPRNQVAPEEAMQSYPPGTENYMRGQEIIINKQMDEARFEEVLKGSIQDALTLPRAWVKLRWIDDSGRDSLGRVWRDPRAQQIARYKTLDAALHNKSFGKDDAEYAEMIDLSDTFKSEVVQAINADMISNPALPDETLLGAALEVEDTRIEELQELNSKKLIDVEDIDVVPHYQGFALESVEPEDIRHDWNIRRPEDIYDSTWMAQRQFMYPHEIAQIFSLNKDQLEERLPFLDSTDSDTSTDEQDRDHHLDEDTANRGGQLAVWELYDRVTQRVYVWVQGSNEYLRTYEILDGPACFFPFHHITLSRSTGNLFGESLVSLLRPLQEELNGLRSHDRAARISSYPRWMIAAGLLSPKERALFQSSAPYSLIETKKAADINSSIFAVTPAPYNPSLFDGSRARNDFQTTSGISDTSRGSVNSNASATADAIASKSQTVRGDVRRDTMMGVLRRICTAMLQINAQRMDERNAKAIAGPGTIWVAEGMTREQILTNMLVEIDAVPNSEAERQAARQAIIEEAQIITQLGLPINKIAILRDLHDLRKTRSGFEKYLDLNALLAPPEPTGSPDNGNPGQQGGRGEEGGRPTNEERSDDVTEPESLPNAPQV